VRIVIGEDSVLFREGLARLLEDHGLAVVATAGDASGALEAIRLHRPDLAILDVRMPPDLADDGARAAGVARSEFPDLGIVLLSQHVETRHSVDLVGGGGFGYLLKDRVLDVDDFIAALRRVAAGGSALDPEVVARLLVVRRRDSPLTLLTARETEVLRLVAKGLPYKLVADDLGLSVRTVQNHVQNTLGKLQLHNRSALVRYALEHGLD